MPDLYARMCHEQGRAMRLNRIANRVLPERRDYVLTLRRESLDRLAALAYQLQYPAEHAGDPQDETFDLYGPQE